MIKLLENLLEVNENSFEFREKSHPIPSVTHYAAYKEDKEAGEYAIEDRGREIHIIGAAVDPEFRGQNATDQFINFLISKFRPRALTVGSEPQAVNFWKKKGFTVTRKAGEGETTQMYRQVT